MSGWPELNGSLLDFVTSGGQVTFVIDFVKVCFGIDLVIFGGQGFNFGDLYD